MSARTEAKGFIILRMVCDFTKRHSLLVPRLLCHKQSQWSTSWAQGQNIHFWLHMEKCWFSVTFGFQVCDILSHTDLRNEYWVLIKETNNERNDKSHGLYLYFYWIQEGWKAVSRCVSINRVRWESLTGVTPSSALSGIVFPLVATRLVVYKPPLQTTQWQQYTAFAFCQPTKKKGRRHCQKWRNKRRQTTMTQKILNELKVIVAFVFAVCIICDGMLNDRRWLVHELDMTSEWCYHIDIADCASPDKIN